MKGQKRNKKRIVLGITGSFGSGKTTAARQFKTFGAKVVDADKIAHSVIRPKTKIYKRLITAFGKGILKRNKIVDRAKLSRIVFNNKILLKRLNRLIHPEIIRVIKKEIKNSKSKLIVLDAPLLIEAGLLEIVDKLIVVKINRVKQLERIMKKTALGLPEILKRIRQQIPLRLKSRLADFVIDNNGTRKETQKQADEIRRLLWKN